ncbi:hypothetical protein ES319_D07G184200v1 [Gossypium barbadense]|uniref:Peroxin-13 n=1 Tax=Gossypium barbadense TaxID=3634 RepID=A0A5J5QU37_GOSBA|nr:hypothetical protein ES319_D07G184200v1 [Gossypium barbadense]
MTWAALELRDKSQSNPSTGESPPKPWEQAGGSSDSGTFKPPSIGSTNDVVEASVTARPGEIVSTTDRTTVVNRDVLGRPLPNKPWEQQTYGSTCGGRGYSSSLNYNSRYGSGMYGSSCDGLGSYGGGLYGNGMYRGGYGGLYENSGMYSGGMYGGGLGMGPYGEQDSNNPFGAPPSPLGFGFPSSLFDRTGVLYGEIARFVLRLLATKTKPRMINQPGPSRVLGPHNHHGNQNYIDASKAAPSVAWDNIWGENISA